MLKKIFDNLKNGKNALIENTAKRWALVISHGIVFVVNDEGLSFLTKEQDASKVFEVIIGEGIGLTYSRIDVLRPLCKVYPFDEVEKELKNAIRKRGVTKLYFQVKKKSEEEAIRTAAVLETFTGLTVDCSVGERKAIEKAKGDVDPLTLGFEEVLTFWGDYPGPVSVSQNLFEKIDDNNRPSARLNVPEADKALPVLFRPSEQLEIVVEGLESDTVKLTAAHKTAIFGVLARLYRITRKNTFWVIKGKVSKELKALVERKGVTLIDTDKIRELTGIENERQLRLIKNALWDLPDIKIWKRYAMNNSKGERVIVKEKASVVYAVTRELEEKENINGLSGVSIISLPEALWNDERYVLIEPWVYPNIHSLPANTQGPASRLVDSLMAYAHREDGKRWRFLKVEEAAECIGYLQRYQDGHKELVVEKISEYLNALVKIGAIDSWQLQDNGAYKVIIGL